MSKIVKVTVGEEIKIPLIKSVNEAGLLDIFKKKKPSETPAETETPPEEKIDNDNDYKSNLEDIATKVTTVTPGTVAFSLSLSAPEVKDLFLKSNGGQALTDHIIVESTDRNKLVAHPGKYLKMSNLVAKSDDNIILVIHVPTSLAKKFEELKDDTVVEEVKKVIKEMLLHRYYVCALFKSQLTSIASGVDSAEGDPVALMKVFNPYVVYHWRDSEELATAKKEWDNYHSPKAQEKKKTAELKDEGDTAAARQTAHLNKIGSGKDIETIILNAIASARGEGDIATNISRLITDKIIDRETAANVLTKLNLGLKSTEIEKAIELLK